MSADIILRDEGFALRSAKKEDFVLFDDVTVIRAEKIDLFSVDEIRVIFERRRSAPVEISEELYGFHDFMKQVVTRFSGSDTQWFEKIVHPPFAPCPTVIWREDRG